jgi:anti-sigma B factor antagonist
MTMETIPVQRENGLIRVSGELTMHHAEMLAPLLLASLPTDGSVARLDLSDVSEIDTAGLQLLMAAHRETVNRFSSLSIVAASQIVRETLELFRQDALLTPPVPAEPVKPARKSRKAKTANKS